MLHKDILLTALNCAPNCSSYALHLPPLLLKCLNCFSFPCKWGYVLLPFIYPNATDTLIFGGILINICIWSGHNSASIIFISFLSHSILIIIPISCLNWLYIIFLLYFGATLRGIYNSTLCVLNYLRLFRTSPLIFSAFEKQHLCYQMRFLFATLKLFRTPSITESFLSQ